MAEAKKKVTKTHPGFTAVQKRIADKESEAKKKEAPATLKVAGKVHRVYKDKKGDVVVNHAGSAKENGKYDKIDLTKKAGAKTVKAGVKATKDWHKNNPHKKVGK